MSDGRKAEWVAGWAFVVPALSVILLFFVLPVLGGLALSFTNFDIYAIGDPATAGFVGFDNYCNLTKSPLFWVSLRNTFFFVVVAAPLSIGVSLAAALLVSSPLARWAGLFRTVYFAPVVTTLVAVAVVWRYLYHPRFGLLNRALAAVGIDSIDWLGDPRTAMPAIILVAVWKSFGYNMVIFVAGLQAIPVSLYEAARIDGAGFWRRFWHITLPSLKPTSVFVGVTTMIGYFQLFAEPYVMTAGGGPLNATLSVVLYMYKEGFRWWNMGYAAAVAFALFLIILGATMLQLRLQRGSSK